MTFTCIYIYVHCITKYASTFLNYLLINILLFTQISKKKKILKKNSHLLRNWNLREQKSQEKELKIWKGGRKPGLIKKYINTDAGLQELI